MNTMRSILVTAFDPFGGEDINPALEAMRRLPSKLGEVDILKVEVPTSFSRCFEVVRNAIDENRPLAIIMLGQAGGREAISVEEVAVNLDEARIPDNDGEQPRNRRIIEDGPSEYRSSLPIGEIIATVSDLGLPCVASTSAGTFVCNHLFYLVMHLLSKNRLSKDGMIPAGFIHVPYETSQTIGKEGVYSLPIEEMVKAVMAIIEVVIKPE